jgi:hypothetical protein
MSAFHMQQIICRPAFAADAFAAEAASSGHITVYN